MPLEISEVQGQSANVKRLMIGGSLDTETAPELDAKISSLVSDAIDLLVLDMKPLDFISSAGLRVIFKATKQMKAKGGQLAVANRQSHITKVFDIVRALLIFKFSEMKTRWTIIWQPCKISSNRVNPKPFYWSG